MRVNIEKIEKFLNKFIKKDKQLILQVRKRLEKGTIINGVCQDCGTLYYRYVKDGVWQVSINGCVTNKCPWCREGSQPYIAGRGK